MSIKINVNADSTGTLTVENFFVVSLEYVADYILKYCCAETVGFYNWTNFDDFLTVDFKINLTEQDQKEIEDLAWQVIS